MMRLSHWLAQVFILSLITADVHSQCIATDDGSSTLSIPLFAGQHIEVGTLDLTVDQDQLEVTYKLTGDWQLVETHLWIGRDKDGYPKTPNGNPKIGHFPYVSGVITGQTSWTVKIPLSSTELSFSCPSQDVMFYIGAHASVRRVDADGNEIQQETAWSTGDKFSPHGSWATLSTISLTCNCDEQEGEPVPGGCETSFAKKTDGTCFLNIAADGSVVGNHDGAFSRWGWTNGPITATAGTTISMNVYAGAGQCSTTKGTFVGTFTATFTTATQLDYRFEMTASGWGIEETHVYVGGNILPDNNGQLTVAPGKYMDIKEGLNKATRTSGTIDFTGSSVYIVAHATVCQ